MLDVEYNYTYSFSNAMSKLEVGKDEHIQEMEMVQCTLLAEGRKTPLFLVKDRKNFILVRSHKEDPRCTVVANAKHKYLQPSLDSVSPNTLNITIERGESSQEFRLQMSSSETAEGVARFIVEARQLMTQQEVTYLQALAQLLATL